MRYTSEAAMDDRGVRDGDHEHWKDKIEVRLDNRQVFFLFFGSALVACLLFILGVIVGKRLESRGKAVAPEVEDPLALLDKVAATPSAEGPAPPPLHPAAPVVAHVAARPEPAAKVTTPPKPVKPVARPAAAAAAPRSTEPAAWGGEEEATAEPEPAAEADEKPVARKPPAAAAPPAAKAPKGPATGRFTLQLGAFPDRTEAEAFAKRFGNQPYVVPAEIAGKGLWYRVRVGDFASAQEAVTAKLAFEKQHGVIALVAGPTAPATPAAPAH
jgi:DedD protein